MVINARSLAKPDAASALHAELHSNNIDICFVSETWLNNRISSHLVCPSGYILLRKDRAGTRNGGGVAIICRSDGQIKCLFASDSFECVWSVITTSNSKYYVAAVCHPPDPAYAGGEFLDYFSDCCEQVVSSDKLFDLLIMSLFLYGIEIWGAAYQGKYLDRIDRFFKRACRFGYTNNLYVIAEVIRNRECKLWNTIIDTPFHPLNKLLPPKKQRFLRKRGHDFIYLLLKQNVLRDLLLIGVFLILINCT